MFELCLFDLDGTLIQTDDLEHIRVAGKNNATRRYLDQLSRLAGNVRDRILIPQRYLERIRRNFPNLRIGVFTRSPKSYASWMLAEAYPDFRWDTVIAFEDVSPSKPYGHGVALAMDQFSLGDPKNVVLIGDNDNDVRSAYHAGAHAVVDRKGWPKGKLSADYWNALTHVPDAIITDPSDITDFLENPTSYLPALERLLSGNHLPHLSRFDAIGHFFPPEWPDDPGRQVVMVAGRYFAEHNSLDLRRGWHSLTESILQNKDVRIFPDEWVHVVRTFLLTHVRRPARVRLSVIPHKPDREPRLETLLQQIGEHMSVNPIVNMRVTTHPTLFRFDNGVQSHHRERLNKSQRFENVRKHLILNNVHHIDHDDTIVLIDDVTTTGASLLIAKQILNAAGYETVICFSLAKTVGELFKS